MSRQLLLIVFLSTATASAQESQVARLPEPVGGWDTLRNKIVYPDLAIRAGIYGAYLVTLTIDSHGKPISASSRAFSKGESLKSEDSVLVVSLERELMATKWNLGGLTDKPMTMQVVIPVVFYLQMGNRVPEVIVISTKREAVKTYHEQLVVPKR